MRWQLPILLCSTVCLLATSAPFDLDVGIPPGSPTSWARRFPSITPGRPLFPETGTEEITGRGGARKGKTAKDASGKLGTAVHTRKLEIDVRISTSFGVVRIITWDLVAHLPWVSRSAPKPKSRRAVTGPGSKKGGMLTPLPSVSDGLYWANMGALLRLLLHPQLVSEKELIVHLAEIGEPVIAILDNAIAEPSLASACRKLRKMITAPRAEAKPPPGATPRATMLKRFLAGELVNVYPYDPEGGFGQRFMLWSEEMQPFLAEYIRHEDSFLRRNAVTALGRYRTDSAMQALAGLAVETTDQVALIRALAALGGYRSLRRPGPLLERLQNTKDPIEKVAFVVALGRMGVGDAVPALLELGRTKDADLLQAVLAALTRIHNRGGDNSVRKFARRIARSAHARPERFRVKNDARVRADIPDGAKARGEIMEQLARLLQVRLDPKHKIAGPFLLGLVSEGRRRGKAGPRGPRGGGAGIGGRRGMPRREPVYPNTSLKKVHPPVQLLLLETLRLLDDKGEAALEWVGTDRNTEPPLRGHALAQLGFLKRGPLVASILDSEDESPEMKIYALEILNNDGHERIKELGLALLEECGEAEAGKGKPEERYLWLQALRALGKRRMLKTEDVLPLLKHVEVRKLAKDSIQRRIRDLVVRMVNDGASGKGRRSLGKQLNAILDLVIKHKINPRVTADKRDEARQKVESRMAGLKGHKGDAIYKNNVSSRVLQYLLGVKVGFTLRDRTQFKPVVLLEEEILFALGRTRSKEAGEALAKFLDDFPESALRAHACLAVGMNGQMAQAQKLLPMLAGDDGFTRFCAYEALRHLCARDIWADWMYGEIGERAAAAEQYVRCVNDRR